MKLSVVLALLLACAFADVIITHDITSGILCSDKVSGLTRVERLVNITYPYSLQNIGEFVWSQFPDMNVGFNLQFNQYVLISYNIITLSPGPSYFLTRVIIDEA